MSENRNHAGIYNLYECLRVGDSSWIARNFVFCQPQTGEESVKKNNKIKIEKAFSTARRPNKINIRVSSQIIELQDSPPEKCQTGQLAKCLGQTVHTHSTALIQRTVV
jgi:hypothetical protein